MVQAEGALAVRNDSSERLWLVAVFALALALRGLAALRVQVIFNDGPAFIDIARALARGDYTVALAHPYHPLYSAFVVATERVLGGPERAGMALSVLFGSLAILALYRLIRLAFDRETALVAAFLVSVHPYAVRFSSDVQSDAVYLAFFIAAAAVLFQAVGARSAPLAFGAGLLAGLAYLTRPEGIGVLVIGCGWALAAGLARRIRIGEAVAFASALSAGFAVLAIPYVAAIRSVSGELQLSQKKSLLDLFGIPESASAALGLEGNLPLVLLGLLVAVVLGGAVAWMARRRSRGSLTSATVAPAQSVGAGDLRFGASAVVAAAVLGASIVVAGMLPHVALDFAKTFISTIRPEMAVLLAVGVFVRSRTPGAGPGLFFGSFVALYVAVLFALLLHYGYVSRRHVLPLVVLLSGYAAIGLRVLAANLSERLRAVRPAWTPARCMAALLLLVAIISLPKALRDHRNEEVAARRAAEWIRAVSSPDEAIASERVKAGYYAQRRWWPLYHERTPYDGAQLAAWKVRWVLTSPRASEPTHPERIGIAPAPGQRFELRHDEAHEGYRALVYEVLYESEGSSR